MRCRTQHGGWVRSDLTGARTRMMENRTITLHYTREVLMKWRGNNISKAIKEHAFKILFY